MKHLFIKLAFFVGLLLPFLGLFSSCSSDHFEQTEQNQQELILKSSLNFKSFSDLSKKIDEQFSKTRSTTGFLTDKEAKDLLIPILEDGKKIQSEILQNYDIDKNSVEYKTYLTLTEQELIILSMISVSNKSHEMTKGMSDLTGGQVLNCTGSALGISGGISGLGLSGLISAKTGLQVLKAVAKRYAFGYIGLAISIYQFGDCLNDLK